MSGNTGYFRLISCWNHVRPSGSFHIGKYCYLQSMACQGYNPLTAIEIALNGNAASMVEKPPQGNPTNQVKGGE